jgi:hypothetical protein
MPGSLPANRDRRRAPAKRRNRTRPGLEELESRTAFAVGAAPFPGALAASQMSPLPAPAAPAQPAVFQGPTTGPAAGATTGASPFGAAPSTGGSAVPNGANTVALGEQPANGAGNLIVVVPPATTNLGQPSSPSGSPVVVVQPQVPTLSPATLSPGALPLNSTAPLAVLDPANYLLARGLNPSLNAGNLPSLLLTQTTETVLEAGGNSGGAGDNAPAVGGTVPIDSGPLPQDEEQIQQGLQESLRFLSSARPVAHGPDVQADHGPTAPEAVAPVGEVQAALRAEAPAADSEW